MGGRRCGGRGWRDRRGGGGDELTRRQPARVAQLVRGRLSGELDLHPRPTPGADQRLLTEQSLGDESAVEPESLGGSHRVQPRLQPDRVRERRPIEWSSPSRFPPQGGDRDVDQRQLTDGDLPGDGGRPRAGERPTSWRRLVVQVQAQPAARCRGSSPRTVDRARRGSVAAAARGSPLCVARDHPVDVDGLTAARVEVETTMTWMNRQTTGVSSPSPTKSAARNREPSGESPRRVDPCGIGRRRCSSSTRR